LKYIRDGEFWKILAGAYKVSKMGALPAAFLQRGSQLRGDPVAHNPNYVARRSGNDVGAILTRVS
jgi:hypothetical protein